MKYNFKLPFMSLRDISRRETKYKLKSQDSSASCFVPSETSPVGRQASRSRGFTLIETLVAIFIFSFSILGIIVISSHGVGDVQYAKNRLIASYLAQEGIELTRNVRDTTVISNLLTGWSAFNTILIPCQNGCSVDYTSWMNGNAPPFTACATPDECLVYYDDSLGYIQNSNYSPTRFSRIIRAQSLSTDELNIVSEVSWTQGSSNTVYSVKAEENLFNWII